MNSELKKFSDSESLEQCDGLEIALAVAFLENVRYSAIHTRPASAKLAPSLSNRGSRGEAWGQQLSLGLSADFWGWGDHIFAQSTFPISLEMTPTGRFCNR
jgi:hypothetical protein